MQLANSANRYGAVPQFLHWITVALVAIGWTLGTFGDDLPKGAARATGLFVHISAGRSITLFFTIIRSSECCLTARSSVGALFRMSNDE